jgi:ubiquinone/menaquinone biosynthesis C-methylase UbiE
MTEILNLNEGDRKFIYNKFLLANEHRNYRIYDTAMDAATLAKAESIFRHFGPLKTGSVIVDAGSGTGTLAELAAKEFRGSVVYALDVSHELAERALDGRTLIEPIYGDASKKVFPDNSVDVKYYSTSGHEIESFGGSMVNAIKASYSELKPEGKLIIRDFVKPERTKPVYMQILSEVGFDDLSKATENGYLDYNLLSTSALFKRFCAEFKGGNAFEFEEVKINGNKYIKLSPEWAHEFYLRKDYTANWRQEIYEKYTYWGIEDTKRNLINAGYADVQVIPDQNEFILQNRLRGKIALFDIDEDGKLTEIPFPPTHMVAIGKKPQSAGAQENSLQLKDYFEDYKKMKESIVYDEKNKVLTIGDRKFAIAKNCVPIHGSKKQVYELEGEPKQVIKVVRKDALNDYAVFKAIFQAVIRENLLDKYKVPHMRITEVDPHGLPYRYFVQEAIPENAVCAAQLISENKISETDIAQIASHVNTFELGKEWQIDTNPFNWYRVPCADDSTEMVYIDGKVYRYDERWEFRRIGLMQWINSSYVDVSNVKTAILPKAKEYEEFRQQWKNDSNKLILLWKKYLHSSLQPE